MLKFRYTHSFNKIPRQCKDCKIFSKCYFHRYKKIPNRIACSEGEFIYKHPDITSLTAEWIVFQIQRNIALFQSNTSSIINNMFTTYHTSRDLIGLDEYHDKSFDECFLFKKALKAFDTYINNNINRIKDIPNKGQQNKEYITLAENIIDTVMKADDKTIHVYTDDRELHEFIKTKVQIAGYEFRTVFAKKEAFNWWGQIMRENSNPYLYKKTG